MSGLNAYGHESSNTSGEETELNLAQIEEVRLLGVRFHKIPVHQLFDRIVEAATGTEKAVVANVNVRAMNLACELPWYQAFLNDANWVFCDGFGVALGAALAGFRMKASHRSTCPDWLESLASICAGRNLRLFLVAGRPGVASEAAAKLKCMAPNLQIGYHHGFFEKVGPENEQVISVINEFKPHILFVGFGMPLQEQWIRDNFTEIEAKVFLPLGACLDFYTGQVHRAPRWMTDNGLEWLGRLIFEPRRLWRRYLIGNPLFLFRVIKQRLGLLKID
jgi:N-acetylglucosaminyldiphosphoundecaprenol N-acetyl-beta-D-mannosaminyltransferase